MDAHAGKRSEGGPISGKKGRNVAFKYVSAARDENVQFCNRIGCSGRIKYSRYTNCGTLDKSSKCSRPSFCSSSGNEIVGTSFNRNSVMTSATKFNLDSMRKLSSRSESSVPVDSFSETPTYQSMLAINGTRMITAAKSGRSNESSNIRPRKPSIPPSSSVLSFSENIGPGPSMSSSFSRFSPRNLKSGSIPDVVSPSCSSVSKYVGKNVMKRRSQEKETSSSRSARKTTVPSSLDKHVSPRTSCTSISNPRRRISCTVGGDIGAATTIRTRSSGNINKGMRLSNRQNEQNFSSIGEPANMETPNNVFSSGSSSHSVSNSDGDNSSSLMSFSLEDLGFTHLRNHHTLPQCNRDGMAEVLLALERIEQDAILTHEQVLALETRFFLSGLNLYDQHRDMRLDIDNMSYEELLALEEKMGTVSTSLSEKTLSKCIRKSTHRDTPLEVQDTGSCKDRDDIKCTICQEEFELGDEVGMLIECSHGYHVTCINQWLRLKNWCPICKASAAPSQSSSSL